MDLSYDIFCSSDLLEQEENMSSFYQNRLEKIHCFFSKNNSYVSHLHRHIELLLVLEGALEIHIDQQIYKLTTGDGIIIFPNQLHQIVTPHTSLIFLCIFDTDFCPIFSYTFLEKQPLSPVFHILDLNDFGQDALSKLKLLETSFRKGAVLTQEVITITAGYLSIFLTVLLRHLTLVPRTNSNDLELQQKILIYIDQHYLEPLSLAHLSKIFGVSRFEISRLFTNKLHIAFPAYVNMKRLEYAAALLRNTQLSVTEIALESGFSATRTFFREFKKLYEMTPSQFRKVN